MTGSRIPNFHPKNFQGATFKMGDHEFPMSVLLDPKAFLPERVRHKRVRLATRQSEEITALAHK